MTKEQIVNISELLKRQEELTDRKANYENLINQAYKCGVNLVKNESTKDNDNVRMRATDLPHISMRFGSYTIYDTDIDGDDFINILKYAIERINAELKVILYKLENDKF